MNAQLTFVHALSPLHAGIGQGSGVIDLPIAREKATGLPFLPGSSLKGALRTRAFNTEDEEAKKLYTIIFGAQEIQEGDNRASAIQFSDQKLLLFPIRSLSGTFAWVTSPYILHRLIRDIEDADLTPPTMAVPRLGQKQDCIISPNNTTITLKIKEQATVYLEDLNLHVHEDENIKIWAEWIGQRAFPKHTEWQQMLATRLCLVHDDVFNFLTTTATEITTRIRLQEDSKTVVGGGLWYEEALPTESILSGIALATPVKDARIKDKLGREAPKIPEIFDILTNLTGRIIQLGGKATVGRGMCRVQLSGKKEA